MNNSANIIDHAIVTHTAWKNRLRALVETGKSEYELYSEHCDFNQWLEAHRDELNWSEYYPKVINLHNQFHKEADKIIELISNGKKREAKMAIGYNDNFDIISWKMLQELVAWHEILNTLTKTKLI